jgi:DNA-directed RNA polymerase subunit N (RpoN/RPB10)
MIVLHWFYKIIHLIHHHSIISLTTVPQPFPKPVLHTVQSNASSFNFQYPLVSLSASNSCLRLLPRLPITSILPSIFPSVTCFRRQFLHQIWPIQLAFPLFAVCRKLTSSSSSSHHFYPSLYLSFSNIFQKAVQMQDVTSPVSLPSFCCCRMFLSSLTVCNTPSFLTWSVQLIYLLL